MHHSKFSDADLHRFVNNATDENEEQGFIYLFGYGSLLWKVDFEFESKLHGFVENFERHFWLLSDDHRGTPESMGRVLTLVSAESLLQKRVYGVAYKIRSTNLTETFQNLNLREKCGYSMQPVIFYQGNDKTRPIKCICYFANEDNHYYSPETDLKAQAHQIHRSVGPSGTNKEYLFNFCNALRDLADGKLLQLEYDSHLFELEEIVKNFE